MKEELKTKDLGNGERGRDQVQVRDEVAKISTRAGQNQFRLVLGREAIESLDEVVNFVNEGFHAGKVARASLAGFLFRNARRYLSKNDLSKLREECFDERLALDRLLKESEKSGELPEALRKMLRDQFKA